MANKRIKLVARTNKRIKLIAGIEFIGGIIGILLTLFALSLGIQLFLAVTFGVLYGLSTLAGWWLWKGETHGVTLSKVILTLQIPIIVFWNVSYKFVSGLSLPLILSFDGSGFFIRFWVETSGYTLSFQSQPPQLNFGINVVALVAFMYLCHVTKSITWQIVKPSPSKNGYGYRHHVQENSIPRPAHKTDTKDIKFNVWTAVQKGDTAQVKALLDTGTGVNATNEQGMTILMLAAEGGQTEVVQILLSHGADVEKRGRYAQTALMCAAHAGHLDVVNALMEQGANIHAIDNQGKTALSHATEHGHLNIVQVLLNAGADVNQETLRLAVEHGYTEIVKVLLKEPMLVWKYGERGKTALILAAEKGYTEIVKVLLETGADVNMKDFRDSKLSNTQDRTALMYASQHNHVEIVQLLVNNGANVNERDYSGETALMYATRHGHTSIVQVLLDKGADVNVRNRILEYCTALWYAKNEGHEQIVQLLEEAGTER